MRLFLLISNAFLLSGSVFFLVHEYSRTRMRDDETIIAIALIVITLLNFIYILRSAKPNSRIFRILDLWMQNKEIELKNKVNQHTS